jgi:ATP-dependent Clp protease ATP-binding subunit ClpC
MELSKQQSEGFTEALKRSRQSAIDLGDAEIGPGHLALGIMRASSGNAFALLQRLGITMHELEAVILDASRGVAHSSSVASGERENIALSEEAASAVKSAVVEVERFGDAQLDTGHLLLGILRDHHSHVADAFARFGATYETVAHELGGAGAGEEMTG